MELFLILPLMLTIFLSFLLFLFEKGRKDQELPLLKGKKLFYFSLPAILAPLFLLFIYNNGGEKLLDSLIPDLILPRKMQSLVLLLILAGSMASSCIFYKILKGLSCKEIPRLFLSFILALFAVFFLIGAVSFNGILPVLPPLCFMGMSQFLFAYRK